MNDQPQVGFLERLRGILDRAQPSPMDYGWTGELLRSHGRGSRPIDSTAAAVLRELITKLQHLSAEDLELALRIVKAHCQGEKFLDSPFVQEVEELILVCPPSESEIEWGIRLIRSDQRGVKVRDSGPCLNCGQLMSYKIPSRSHQQRGDEWLDSVFRRWQKPPHIGVGVIGEWASTTVEPYLCQSCWDAIQSIAFDRKANIEEELKQQSDQQKKNRQERHRAIIEGTVQVEPEYRFRVLCQNMTLIEADRLRLMPYQEFLRTPYWSAVRNYVLWLRSGRCQLCFSIANLNVHHPPKLYGMRGYEYQNPEQLVLLCQPCHAKFHGKFDREEKR
jgi:5-methylcytosine-specific restriction endonuclease McrA